jgi:hypothetical protein
MYGTMKVCSQIKYHLSNSTHYANTFSNFLDFTGTDDSDFTLL